MIEHPFFDGLVYRVCSMEYFRTGYGGKGARLGAGRFNRKGSPAVYVATDLLTAYTEFQRGDLSRPDPCVVIAARLRARNLIDLTGDLSACHPDVQNWRCDWEDARDDLDLGIKTADCASWRCMELAVKDRRAGFVYPSTLHSGGINIVFYPEDATAGDVHVEVIDPRGLIGKAARGVI